MVRHRIDLVAVAGYAVLAAAAVWILHPRGGAGIILVPLVVVCPGYALVCAIEGRRRPDLLELAVTTVALSFATAALGGLVLNAFKLGLTPNTWTGLFLVVTVAATALAAWRRVGTDDFVPRRSVRIRALPVLATAIICALAAAAAVIAVRSQQGQDSRTATTALGVVRSDDGSTLRISVVNSDAGPRRYRVRIAAGRRTTSFFLTLAGGEHWSGTRRVARSFGGAVRIELLKATPSHGLLRTVILTRSRRKPSNA